MTVTPPLDVRLWWLLAAVEEAGAAGGLLLAPRGKVDIA